MDQLEHGALIDGAQQAGGAGGDGDLTKPIAIVDRSLQQAS